MSKIRCGIIGIGGMGRSHGVMMNDGGQMALCAVCDINQDLAPMVAEKFPEAAFYSDVDEFFSSAQLDLVTVVLPHNLHAPFAIRALEKGWHTIVEKPMATHYADAKAMIEAAKRTGKMLTVYHNRRLDGWYLTAKSVIEQGLLGKVFEINIGLSGFGTYGTWRERKEESGGVMFDWGAHLVDYALHFAASEVVTVSGFFYQKEGQREKNQDHGRLQMRFESGALADITVSTADYFGAPWRYKILGDRGSLLDKWQWDEKEKVSVVTSLKDGLRAEMSIPYTKASAQQFYGNVVAHLNNGEPLMVTPESAAKVINVLETAELSDAQGGKPLPLQA